MKDKKLINSCKKLGYSLSENESGFTVTPLVRGMVIHFQEESQLIDWIKQEAQNQINDFYLMEWGK